MAVNFISWAAVAVILGASIAMLINLDWRISLSALAIVHLSAFWLVLRHLPFAMASAKLVTGWMVVATLGMTRLNLQQLFISREEETFWPRGRLFRIILMLLIVVAAGGSTPRIEAAIPGLGLPVVAGGLLLIGAGILQFGVTTEILRVFLGLATMLAGFEIIYAAVESSILVTGLLSIVNLGLGLTGSYLMSCGETVHEVQGDA